MSFFAKGTAHQLNGNIYISGGATLKVNTERESNQIYQYVTNTRVFKLGKYACRK